MSLRRIESFDHFTTAAQLAVKEGWSTSGTVTIEAAAGRRSSGNLRTAGSNGCFASLALPSSHASGVIGLAFSQSQVNSGFSTLRILDSGGTVHLDIELDASAHLEVRRGIAGTVLATGTTVIAANTYNYLEMKFTIDNAAGSVEIRLNGSASAELSFSGDTQNGGLTNWQTLQLRGQELSASSPLIRWDDIYLCDGDDSTGTHGITNNDFLGDCRADAVFPSTGNGANVDFTPSSGSDHGAMVDETTPNGDTDYNSGANVGEQDTYAYPDLSFVPAIIFGVQGVNYVKKSDAGARSVCDVIRSNGAEYDGSDHSLTTSYTFVTEVWESDPDTSLPWELPAVNALEHGTKVTV